MFTRALFLTSTAVALAGIGSAQSRYFFSVNWQSPSVGTPDALGTPITEGDVLRTFNTTSMPQLAPTAAPEISFSHGTSGLGLPGGCVGHPGGTPCIVEVDAFSRGGDRPFEPANEILPGQIMFSVDEFARGVPMPFGAGPNVSTEANAREAAADGFLNVDPLPPGPFGPLLRRNVGVVDGDGLPSLSGYAYPGTGLKEPITTAPGMPDDGDDKDFMDLVESVAPPLPGPYFYSLDASFFDPLEGVPHSGSAVANGFVGGDVLRSSPSGPVVYAPAAALGLDLVAGPDTDDLDALILFENGTPGYQPSLFAYDWVSGATDMLVFSVRRGSALIGLPDSALGLPIEEGDLLIPPSVQSPSPLPGIFVPAEALGLNTRRSGNVQFGDELDAADSVWEHLYDCDGDGVEDAIAIITGLVADANQNGVPDSCEGLAIGIPFCLCDAAVAPCGNASPASGCINVTGQGALLTGLGSTSVAADDLVLQTTNLPPGTFSLMFMSTAIAPPSVFGNGLRCLAGSAYRFTVTSTGTGTQNLGPGLAAFTVANNPVAGHIVMGSTWNFQNGYRDIGGPCGAFINWSNGLSVTFTP